MRIDDILHYWDSTRGAGHTELSLGNVTRDTEFVFVAVTQQQARDIQHRFPKARTLTIDQHHDSLYRRALPLIVDHAAMARLVRAEQERLMLLGREMKRP